MTTRLLDVLVVGATGSVGRQVAARGHKVRALVRELARNNAAVRGLDPAVAETGLAQTDLEPMFAALIADSPSTSSNFDAIRDMANMPPDEEPQRVRQALLETSAHSPLAKGAHP